MPTYSYRCTECSHAFDIHQSFTDDALTECPNCGGVLRKVFSPVGVTFSGSGFYRTDSRAAAKSSEGGSSSSSSGSSDSGASSSGSSSSGSSSSGSSSSGSKGSGSKGSGSKGSGSSSSSGSSAAAS